MEPVQAIEPTPNETTQPASQIASSIVKIIELFLKTNLDENTKQVVSGILGRSGVEVKQFVDAVKHLSTLCSGILIASLAFRSNITANSKYPWIVATAVGCFLLSLILSLITYFVVLQVSVMVSKLISAYATSTKEEHKPAREHKSVERLQKAFGWLLSFTFLFFVAGGVMVFIFFVLNI